MLFWLICPSHTPTGARVADFFMKYQEELVLFLC